MVSDAALDTAVEEYTRLLTDFEKKCKSMPFKRKASSLFFTLCEITETARKAIDAQYEGEKQKIEDLFAGRPDPNFVTNIVQLFGLTTPPAQPELDRVKKQMLDKVEKSHTEQLGQFDKNTEQAKVNLAKHTN